MTTLYHHNIIPPPHHSFPTVAALDIAPSLMHSVCLPKQTANPTLLKHPDTHPQQQQQPMVVVVGVCVPAVVSLVIAATRVGVGVVVVAME